MTTQTPAPYICHTLTNAEAQDLTTRAQLAAHYAQAAISFAFDARTRKDATIAAIDAHHKAQEIARIRARLWNGLQGAGWYQVSTLSRLYDLANDAYDETIDATRQVIQFARNSTR